MVVEDSTCVFPVTTGNRVPVNNLESPALSMIEW